MSEQTLLARASRVVPLIAVLVAACGDSGTPPEPPGPPVPTVISVSPSSVAFTYLAETVTFTATIADQYGAAYNGVPSWSGSDPSVFEINADGTATSIGNGQGIVTASFQELSATASVTVQQAPSELRQAGGSDQRARAGRTLPEPVVVKLVDTGGSPVEGATVTFTPGEGHGTAEPVAVESDSAGLAQTAWTLGPTAGPQSLAASVAGGPSAQIGAVALAPEETVAVVEQAGGSDQRARAGRTLPEPVVVKLVDAGGSPVEGATVTFTPGEGHGTAEPVAVESDSAGLAQTTWTLGSVTGAQSLAASVAGGPSAQIGAVALTPEEAVAVVEQAGGADQRARAGHGLPEPVVVRLVDADGSPVEGATVTFTPGDGHGTAEPAAVESDSAGLAQTTWTLGGAIGTQVLVAAVDRVSVTVLATALRPVASAVSFSQSRLGPAEAGKRYQGDALVATVTDSAGVPVVGASYRWLAAGTSAGWMFPPTGVTDDRGMVVTTSWIGGWPGEGTMTLVVENDGSADLRTDLNTTTTSSRNPPNGAVSVWMGTEQRVLAQGFSVDMTPLAEPCGTYYAAIQWDGGYTGLQRCGSQYDRQLQFSVWNVPNVGGAEVIRRGQGVRCRTFGGEGTGQACELNYPWKLGSTYRFEVTEAELNGGSALTLYVTDVAAGDRRFVGTLRYARRADLRSFAMFTEDFIQVAPHCLARAVRSASIRRAMALVDGTWQSLTQGRMSRWLRDPWNPGTPGCANVAVRNHPTGLEVVVGGDPPDPDGPTVFQIPK